MTAIGGIDRVTIWHFAVEHARSGLTAARRGLDYTRGLEYPLAYNLACLPRHGRLALLDIGSGASALFPRLVGRRTNTSVIAFEQRSDALAAGRFAWTRGDAVQLPFVDRSFDRVTLVSTIEHLPGDADGAAMSEVGRVLKPGGRCVLTTPYHLGRVVDEYRDGPVYGRGAPGERVFFERAYDDRALGERLIVPSRLAERERRYFGEIGWSFERFQRRFLRGGALSKLVNVPFGLLMPLLTLSFFRDLGTSPPGGTAGKAAGKGGGVALVLEKSATQDRPERGLS